MGLTTQTKDHEASAGTAVVYDEQPPPAAGVPTDGEPLGDEAVGQLQTWLDGEREEERLEVLQAISSGEYQLRPVSLAEGDMTPYEEAMAGAAGGGAAATPTGPGGRKRRRSPGALSGRARQDAGRRVGRGDDGDDDQA